MQVTAKVEVVGMKKFEGVIEGVSYDSTTLFVKTELDESRETAKGFATVEYKFGTSAEFDRFKSLRFPFLAECDIELTTTGRKESKRITAIRPVVPAGAQSAAVPAVGK